MNVPEDLLYCEDHLWLRREPGERVRLGITDYAQDALGEVAFVDLPTTGTTVSAGEAFGEVESTKSVTELCTPVDGEVVEVNDGLELSPDRINEDPYGDGWICVLALAHPGSLDLLMGAEAYRALIDA
ncbi:MAG: glycine cleavage system protein GcvH [Acidimicrobiales bacterium]|nr:glycine cleavage system protein GcvH [Acidimicrobiales bacterium]